MAGLPVKALTLRTCFALKNVWEGQFKGGMARVTRFDPRLDAGIEAIGRRHVL